MTKLLWTFTALLPLLLPACGDNTSGSDIADALDEGRDDGSGADAAADGDADADADGDTEPDAEADDVADADDVPVAVCGDGRCEDEEHCGTCPDDCCVCPPSFPPPNVDDALTSAAECSGTRSGGEFDASGWRTTDRESRIVYDVGAPLDCGAVHVDIGPFDPLAQYIHGLDSSGCPDNGTPDDPDDDPDCYLNFLGLYQGDHGDHWTAAESHETTINVQATAENPESSFRNTALKIKAVTGSGDGWGGGGDAYTEVVDWGLDHQLCLEWDGTGTRLFVDGAFGAEVAFEWDSTGATGPGLQYVFLGRTTTSAGGWLDGATYSGLRIIPGGTCP